MPACQGCHTHQRAVAASCQGDPALFLLQPKSRLHPTVHRPFAFSQREDWVLWGSTLRPELLWWRRAAAESPVSGKARER